MGAADVAGCVTLQDETMHLQDPKHALGVHL
jgi:hypothetical protein